MSKPKAHKTAHYAAKSAAPSLPVTHGVAAGSATPVVSAEPRRRMIAEAAYFLAEQRGFDGQDPDGDWLAAERQIDQCYPLAYDIERGEMPDSERSPGVER